MEERKGQIYHYYNHKMAISKLLATFSLVLFTATHAKEITFVPVDPTSDTQ